MIALLLGLGLAYGADDGIGWRLAAVYDMASISVADAPKEAPPDPILQLLMGADEKPGYVYRPARGMSKSCGPAKAPDGLRIFEAQAVANGLTPTMAVVLEGTADSPELDTGNVRVTLGKHGEPEAVLQPMVSPRALEIQIDYDKEVVGTAQVIRTQLEMQACLEHKVGRAWRGHSNGFFVKQAFLLASHYGDDRSRKYFGGELEPVPALLGPPDTCVRMVQQRSGIGAGEEDIGKPSRPAYEGERGEGKDYLIPTDVWGASLRDCDATEARGRRHHSMPPRVAFESSYGDVERYMPRWHRLQIQLRPERETLFEDDTPPEERVHVTLTYHGDTSKVLEDGPLYVKAEGPAQPGKRRESSLMDILGKVEYQYPEVTTEDGRRYVVLLVPNWQIVEALRRLDGLSDSTREKAWEGTIDGVGQILSRPDWLFVHVMPQAPGQVGRREWPDQASALRHFAVRGPFGYTVQSREEKSQIVVPEGYVADITEFVAAHRSVEQSAVSAGFFLIVLLSGAGLFRVTDLITRAPEERADYWPGPAQVVLADSDQNAADEVGEETGE